MLNVTAQDLEKAIVFATEKHSGQVRKGDGRPYIMHPMSVMIRLHQVKTSKNIFLLMAACILHDTVEDCGIEIGEIAEKFGYHVASLVEELTLDKGKYKTIGKSEYLAQEVMKMSSYALVIKLCDRLDNICDTKSMNEEFKTKYVKETEYIIERLEKRTITKTHVKLIKMIKIEIKKLKSKVNGTVKV